MRKIIKRSVVVLLAGVLLFSLSGCKKKQKKDEVQRYAWPLGTSSPEDTVTQLYAEKFAKEVSRLSHGKMKIEVYPNSTLGGDRELLESCKDGEDEFVITVISFLVSERYFTSNAQLDPDSTMIVSPSDMISLAFSAMRCFVS